MVLFVIPSRFGDRTGPGRALELSFERKRGAAARPGRSPPGHRGVNKAHGLQPVGLTRMDFAYMEPTTTQETEFVWRRLADTLKLFGQELDGHFWLAILIPVLIIAFAYVIWMYVRDGRSVGWGWASLLGALRIAVYLVLALVFLLPAEQTWERTETRSKVILLIDVSGSMATKDGLPTEAIPVEKLLSRQDQVIQFLTSDQIKFIKRLQEKNPMTLYRFGPQIDEKFEALDPEQPWSQKDWTIWLKLDPKREIPDDLDEEAKAKERQKLELEAFLVSRTNLAESLLAVINRESNNMLQGIIVISDGRST